MRSNSAVIAGKTGTTPAAKECLLSVMTDGKREYIVVLLRSDDRYGDMRNILNAFVNASAVTLRSAPSP